MFKVVEVLIKGSPVFKFCARSRQVHALEGVAEFFEALDYVITDYRAIEVIGHLVGQKSDHFRLLISLAESGKVPLHIMHDLILQAADFYDVHVLRPAWDHLVLSVGEGSVLACLEGRREFCEQTVGLERRLVAQRLCHCMQHLVK